MKMVRAVGLTLLLLLPAGSLSGCGTMVKWVTNGACERGEWKRPAFSDTYGGTQMDVWFLGNGGAIADGGGINPFLFLVALIDLPLSFVMDTVLLPFMLLSDRSTRLRRQR